MLGRRGERIELMATYLPNGTIHFLFEGDRVVIGNNSRGSYSPEEIEHAKSFLSAEPEVTIVSGGSRYTFSLFEKEDAKGVRRVVYVPKPKNKSDTIRP